MIISHIQLDVVCVSVFIVAAARSVYAHCELAHFDISIARDRNCILSLHIHDPC